MPGGRPGIFAPPEEPEGLALVLKAPLADTDIPLTMDPVELDAERRERTVVLLDPQTRRLRKAYLHLPVYLNSVEPGGYGGGREAVEIFRLLNSKALPWRTPIECEVNYYRLGESTLWLKIEGVPDPDPIHTFFAYPNRHLLHHTEMAQYPVLFLCYIDVESTQAMVEYLASGGFAVVNPGQLKLLHSGLQKKAGKRAQRVTVDLGHPLFHCWSDITGYWEANQYCPAITPLSGLELDGRLVALCSPPFIGQYPCPSNKLYINVLVFGLTQPSRMGGRYRSMH